MDNVLRGQDARLHVGTRVCGSSSCLRQLVNAYLSGYVARLCAIRKMHCIQLELRQLTDKDTNLVLASAHTVAP